MCFPVLRFATEATDQIAATRLIYGEEMSESEMRQVCIIWHFIDYHHH